MIMRRSLGLSDTAPLAVHYITSPIAVAVVAVAPSRNVTICSFRGTKDAVDVLTDIQFFSKAFVPREPLRGPSIDPSSDPSNVAVGSSVAVGSGDASGEASGEAPGGGVGEGEAKVAKTAETKAKEMKVHGGFLNAWLSVADEVCRVVDHARSRHLVLTGHSMGGAVAQLAAAYLADSLPKTTVINLVTVGAPAIGDAGFKGALESAAVPRGGLHFTGVGDPVPRVGSILGESSVCREEHAPKNYFIFIFIQRAREEQDTHPP